LTVTSTRITQVAPTAARTPTGKAFNDQLELSGAHGNVTYAQSTGALVLKVSSSGKVSAPATLVAGAYKATGSARDTLGDTGTWSFALTVTATKITQVAPATARTPTGKAFTGQLKVSGSHGTVTYAQSTGAPRVKLSSSGKISVAATLVAGTYKAAGTARDTLGDTGTWSFALTVVATRLSQVAPTSATSTAGKAFTGQLKVSGSHGAVTYAQSTGALDLRVSSSGKISVAATLVAGTYKATGTARDNLGDTGTWSFALRVVATKLTQVAPDTAVNRAGKAFTGQLRVSGSHGTVTYAQSVGAPHLKVSSSGKISAAAGLAAGIYKAKGTAKDTYGATGTWTFALTVKGSKLTQIAPTTGTTTAGKAFTVKLGVTGSHGTVTFIQSSTGAQILTVLPSGTLLAPDIYTPGTYKITGTVKDSLGDIGTWSFTLTVEAAALPQDLQAAKGPSEEMRASAV
jgi:putative sterol carrier protein